MQTVFVTNACRLDTNELCFIDICVISMRGTLGVQELHSLGDSVLNFVKGISTVQVVSTCMGCQCTYVFWLT